MSLIQTDNGDGTITFSNIETGKVWPPIAKTEIARRKADAEATRAAMQPPLAGDVFLSRLTDKEYIDIKAAASAQEASSNAQLSRWIETLRATNRINLAGAEAQAAKAALVAAGLLTAPRADIVFAAH
jgi:hypothetical protein